MLTFHDFHDFHRACGLFHQAEGAVSPTVILEHMKRFLLECRRHIDTDLSHRIDGDRVDPMGKLRRIVAGNVVAFEQALYYSGFTVRPSSGNDYWWCFIHY